MFVNTNTCGNNPESITFNAKLVRNLNVANKPEVKQVMGVAQDFLKKTTEKFPNLELRMYQDGGDEFVRMSLYKITDRAKGQAKGVIGVKSLVEDNPSNAKLVGRLKKLLSYLKKESDLMRLSDDEIIAGKGMPIVKQMKKIAGKDNVLLNDLEIVRDALGC